MSEGMFAHHVCVLAPRWLSITSYKYLTRRKHHTICNEGDDGRLRAISASFSVSLQREYFAFGVSTGLAMAEGFGMRIFTLFSG